MTLLIVRVVAEYLIVFIALAGFIKVASDLIRLCVDTRRRREEHSAGLDRIEALTAEVHKTLSRHDAPEQIGIVTVQTELILGEISRQKEKIDGTARSE